MDEIVDKCRTSSTKDSKQAIPQTTFGLVILNHFGISVRDLDRSMHSIGLSRVRNLTRLEIGLAQAWAVPQE
jgi:hypothetical protein